MAESSSSSLKVQIYSVKAGYPAVVRFFDQIQGALFHWHNGRSHPCQGHGSCPSDLHKKRTVWKGFAPGDVWDSAGKLWMPAAIEVTESLEEQLRGVDLRGQSYLLTRVGASASSHGSVQAVFVEEWDAVPLPFSVHDVLCRVYRVERIDLTIPNPVRAAIFLEPSKDRAPVLPSSLKKEPAPDSLKAAESIKEQIEKAARAKMQS